MIYNQIKLLRSRLFFVSQIIIFFVLVVKYNLCLLRYFTSLNITFDNFYSISSPLLHNFFAEDFYKMKKLIKITTYLKRKNIDLMIIIIK